MPIDHPQLAPDHDASACTREHHEELKRDSRTFKRATRKVGHLNGTGRGRELRNCERCGSTLVAPRRKARRPASQSER